eukprot:5790029-Pleurochrysis_carterae.AAC.1
MTRDGNDYVVLTVRDRTWYSPRCRMRRRDIERTAQLRWQRVVRAGRFRHLREPLQLIQVG